MIDNLLNAFRIPDLRNKLLYTIGLLLVFRVIAHIPVPGVDLAKLRELFANNQLLGLLNLFSGGALQTFSVAAMGVYPYITASIIMQLLMPLVPRLEALSKEGEMGRNKLNQYTRIMTVPLAFLQGFGQVSLLQRSNVLTNFNLFNKDTFLPSFALLVALTTGTMLLVWIGELITEYGIGNGISLIIFAGIVARLPQGVGQSIVSGTSGTNIMGLAVFGIIGAATIIGIVVVQEGQRRIPVQYSKRIRGTRMYQGQSTHIPLKVNSAGMIPLIFALSIMIFPGTIASYFQASSNAGVSNFAGGVVNFFNSQTGMAYWILYFVLTVAFTYFYTAVTFQQQNLPENLQKNGGFIPGIRPGRPTAEYLNKVLNRITLVGALFLGLVAILPFFARTATNIQNLAISSTGLLIVVGVVLDTMKQMEAQLLMRNYTGFIK
ncbi:MAG TPA: preprotein translocase subunit SecY [Chloroflexota bacterium]|jgi:preprotein translocase subunit SecY